MAYHFTPKWACVALVFYLLQLTTQAQAPNAFSYQAVVRDASNQLIINLSVGFQISILQGAVDGTPVYVETHTPTTDDNGVAYLDVGGGTPVSGVFESIDWSNGPYFVKSETDPTGGTNYTISGTTQLLSVPFALHAEVADSLTAGQSLRTAGPSRNVILGRVNHPGDVCDGEGFTVNRIGVGIYEVSFDQAFTSSPMVFVTTMRDAGGTCANGGPLAENAFAFNINPSQLILHMTNNSGGLVDSNFSFMIIGEQP